MLILGTVVLGAAEPARAVAFWAAALDLVPAQPYAENEFTGLSTKDGRVLLAVQRSEHAAEPEPRLHLDLYARDRADRDDEVGRLLGLGATRVDWPHYPPDPDFVVLADPEGNRFCVVDDSHAPEQLRILNRVD